MGKQESPKIGETWHYSFKSGGGQLYRVVERTSYLTFLVWHGQFNDGPEQVKVIPTRLMLEDKRWKLEDK